jgi:hypothetical protein
LRQWQRWGLAGIAVLGMGALLWTSRSAPEPDSPARPSVAGPAVAPTVAVPDGIALQPADSVAPALSVSFLGLPPAARRAAAPAGGPDRARSAPVAAEELHVAAVRGGRSTVPEPTHLLWPALAFLATARRSRRRRAA